MTDDVRDAYDHWALTYDSDTNPTRDLDAALVRDIDWSALDVVEIGCGTGKNSAWIAPRCRSLIGLDLSPAMLEHAIRTVPEAHFVEADLTQPWHLGEATADAVVADLVLEHIADLRHFYAESYRVLRPGGHLRIAELHPCRQLLGGRAHFDESAPLADPSQCVAIQFDRDDGAELRKPFEERLLGGRKRQIVHVKHRAHDSVLWWGGASGSS
jgi:ubiquinone/menaquinone biosynthesis C-methylase UbiE